MQRESDITFATVLLAVLVALAFIVLREVRSFSASPQELVRDRDPQPDAAALASDSAHAVRAGSRQATPGQSDEPEVRAPRLSGGAASADQLASMSGNAPNAKERMTGASGAAAAAADARVQLSTQKSSESVETLHRNRLRERLRELFDELGFESAMRESVVTLIREYEMETTRARLSGTRTSESNQVRLAELERKLDDLLGETAGASVLQRYRSGTAREFVVTEYDRQLKALGLGLPDRDLHTLAGIITDLGSQFPMQYYNSRGMSKEEYEAFTANDPEILRRAAPLLSAEQKEVLKRVLADRYRRKD